MRFYGVGKTFLPRWQDKLLESHFIFLIVLGFSTTIGLVEPVFGLDFPDVKSCFDEKRSTPEEKWMTGLCYKISSRELYSNPSTSAFLEHITATRAEFGDFIFESDILVSDFHRFSRLLNLDFFDGKTVKLEELKEIYFQMAWFTHKEQFLKLYRGIISNPKSEEEKRNLEYLAFLFRDFPNEDVFPFKHLDFKKVHGKFSKQLTEGKPVTFELVNNEIKFNKLDFSPAKTQALVMVSIDCGFSKALLDIISKEETLRSWFSKNATILVVQNLNPSEEDYFKWNELNPDLKYQYLLKESFIPVPLNWPAGVPQVYFIKGKRILYHKSGISETNEANIGELSKGIDILQSSPK
jgi:hypothetical protein